MSTYKIINENRRLCKILGWITLQWGGPIWWHSVCVHIGLLCSDVALYGGTVCSHWITLEWGGPRWWHCVFRLDYVAVMWPYMVALCAHIGLLCSEVAL